MSEPGERGRVASVVANCWVIRVGARASIVALDVAETEHRQHCRCRRSSLLLDEAQHSRRATSVPGILWRIQDLPSSLHERLEPAGGRPDCAASRGAGAF